ncbi:MAG: phosphatase PAP2 family protein, partial [Rhodospirillales bacterium]|nr:phosphatase PAP2 family protein [Rhodospirillales bacterium]
FGRARPRELEIFGGSFPFTPFYLVSEACRSNCSFVSGHAGMAFSTFALSFLPRDRSLRLWLFSASLAFGLLTGWMRVIQGGHFLSDVLFSGLVVYGIAWLIALALLRPWLRRADAAP